MKLPLGDLLPFVKGCDALVRWLRRELIMLDRLAGAGSVLLASAAVGVTGTLGASSEAWGLEALLQGKVKEVLPCPLPPSSELRRKWLGSNTRLTRRLMVSQTVS